jgi:two-component system nitrogen regulation sensor histidine kinase NtrY
MVALRVVVLSGLIMLAAFTFFATQWVVTPILLMGLALLMTWELLRYVNKTNRDLSNFLDSIRHHDFTANFSSGARGKTFEDLKDSFNGIIHEFRKLEAEKESHHHYLQTVIEHISVALICFVGNDEVVLMNNAAKELLSKPYIKRIGALEKVDEQFMATVAKIKVGERELVKLLIRGEIHQIAIQAAEFRLMEKDYKLLSFQDIRSELDVREVEAWQKLIRVLTHEIMNSITPVSTLSGVLAGMVGKDGQPRLPGDLSAEDISDLNEGLQTIESRTKGLMRFIQAYRSLLKVPKPEFKEVVVQEVLVRMRSLFKSELANGGIRLEMDIPKTPLIITADPELLEQVLINLIKNAMEALKGQEGALIELVAFQPKENKVVVEVRDNGQGIEDEFLDQVFVPFFTTKHEGSGIGLSLSRQIMQLHKGNISFRTVCCQGTVFVLEF